ncbi:hypothetical protein [Tenacibaculum sp. IB213877]|uniref:hypothetical protein n=1 Tax=Tenacibaculum sp. IB213877 TaxID=3097351 RepID=UPI002A5A3703|nr:hypothetical protein [Tenacibaculum sp. IB213877]MDY0780089.1 hypothetical protein [Tenacibaculum sp. IB213877]
MKTFLKLLLLFLTISCVKDLDFNQAEDLELYPEVAVSLVKFDLTESELSPAGSGVYQLSQEVDFTAFDNSTAQEDLTRVDLDFEISNEFNRDFTLEFTFLDDNDVATYMPIVLNVDANQTDYAYQEQIIISNNPNFLNSQKIQITVTILASTDGSTIDPTIPKTFTFKSGGTFHFTIDSL